MPESHEKLKKKLFDQFLQALEVHIDPTLMSFEYKNHGIHIKNINEYGSIGIYIWYKSGVLMGETRTIKGIQLKFGSSGGSSQYPLRKDGTVSLLKAIDKIIHYLTQWILSCQRDKERKEKREEDNAYVRRILGVEEGSLGHLFPDIEDLRDCEVSEQRNVYIRMFISPQKALRVVALMQELQTKEESTK